MIFDELSSALHVLTHQNAEHALRFTRFAFAYLTSYHPMLESINTGGRDYRAPWYVNLFRRKGVDLKSSMAKVYCFQSCS